MGCGGSKRLEPEAEAIPERIRPLLRRRYEEIRNKSRGIHIAPLGRKATSTLSKKELLGEGDASSEDIDVEMDDDRRSESSEEGNMKVAPVAEEGSNDHHPKKAEEEGLVKAKVSGLSSPLSTIVDEKKVVEEIAVVPSPEANRNDEKRCGSNEQTSERSKVGIMKVCLEPEEKTTEMQVPALVCPASNVDEAEVVTEKLADLPGPVPEDDDVVVAEETKELGPTFSFKPLLFPPGSPSFRVYLNAPSIQVVEEVEGSNNGSDIVASDDHSPPAVKEVELETAVKEVELETVRDSPIETESQVKEDEKDTEVESKSSTESFESVHSDEAKKRSGRRGLRFKGKLPRTSGMKNLFKVQSCYSSCSCGQSSTLLEQKSVGPK